MYVCMSGIEANDEHVNRITCAKLCSGCLIQYLVCVLVCVYMRACVIAYLCAMYCSGCSDSLPDLALQKASGTLHTHTSFEPSLSI
jgi:hypothetical protein